MFSLLMVYQLAGTDEKAQRGSQCCRSHHPVPWEHGVSRLVSELKYASAPVFRVLTSLSSKKLTIMIQP